MSICHPLLTSYEIPGIALNYTYENLIQISNLNEGKKLTYLKPLSGTATLWQGLYCLPPPTQWPEVAF